jgi:small-conductance mechanosensitive channel/CRP-like cAMP-binding protein
MGALQSSYMIATAALFAVVVLSIAFHGRPLWWKLLVDILALAFLTHALRELVGSPIDPSYSPVADNHLWQQMLEAGWWVLAARVAIILTRLAVVLENRPRETKFFSDLLVGVIYIAAILAIIKFSFTVHIQGVLETSGVIAIVLGLALQSTLSDVFSGIAVGIEKPFKPGDILWVEGDVEGRVAQINWRSTHIITGDANIAIIPNSVIARSRILNRSLPTVVRGVTLTVRLYNGAEAALCVETLSAAIKACRLPLKKPVPEVNCATLAADGNEYQVTFYVASTEFLAAARDEVNQRIQRHLLFEGISFAAAGQEPKPAPDRPTITSLLERSELLKILAPEVRDILAKYFLETTLSVGDRLLVQGEIPEAMMIITGGAAELTINRGGHTSHLYNLSPGDSIGAIGLFTSSKAHSSAIALTVMTAFRLTKADVAKALKENVELGAGLEALARCSSSAVRRDTAAPDDVEIIHEELMLSRIRNFFHILIQSK